MTWTDARGRVVEPGDVVSVAVWPKGRVRGVVEASGTARVVAPGGRDLGPCAVVVAADGERYGPVAGEAMLLIRKRG